MRVLITGATGMIGTEITRACQERNIAVNYLTTKRHKIQRNNEFNGFYWNPSKGEIDTECLKGVGTIINLAGANIFRRWTDKNKKKIVKSRLDGLDLLFRTLTENEHMVGQLISASGISVYPSSLKKMYYEDETELSDSFLGKLVRDWEAAAERFSSLGLRVAQIRTGIVLSDKGGALPQMQRPVEYGFGAALGSGKQWQSWIHINDLARLYLYVVSNGLEGVYNAVAPDPVTNKEMTQEIAKNLGARIRLPNVPAFVLKLVLGEMANLALESQLVASKKIQDAGFSFHYVNLKKALRDIDQIENRH